MKQQSYLEYLQTRIQFNFQVGLWLEFKIETEIPFKVIKDAEGMPIPERGEVEFRCQPLAREAKINPKLIVERLAPYVESVEGVEKVEAINGYLNVFFERATFLINMLHTSRLIDKPIDTE